MTHKDLSKFSNEELKNFQQLELNIQQLQELSDKLCRTELTIPEMLAEEIECKASYFGNFENFNLRLLQNAIYVMVVILEQYQPSDESAFHLNGILIVSGKLLLHFWPNKQSDQQ